ncbi:protein SICKLE-like [Diospyros lotus]|uniref:protein SICKLE-like n=1 Tax=Diospyros lotus TaxID=55363 RepID=UPI00225953D2|nr:protein SICKLE-like [Diospyros lotus]XP_052190257.1 protein SICKLE-like [Diospyros lotus]XP_052190258.1 protein SICKLE-like [Diospyros lotus]XP_052190259.1 protein SICKLE-like [Diospyros lotus]XP_052190260.1 protein SICKLE-like [Diospyros lotus]XP_052190261.1 protein SICKLE-like [Diospyros lotus]XP_052190262.1 protein SICKLE-like [Diospyros lotus]
MEESEKRRERLKAMRMEALQGGVNNEVGNFGEPQQLSNPLIETSTTLPLHANTNQPARFDYYTDPMSAFSTNKRRSMLNDENSQDYFTPARPRATPSPAHQFQPNYSPDQRQYQARAPYYSPGPRNPPPAHQFQSNHSPDQTMHQVWDPYKRSIPSGSPIGTVNSFGSHQGTPRGWNSPVGSGSYNLPSNSPGGNFSSPHFGGSPRLNTGWGRSQWFSNSPSSISGHGGSSTSNLGGGSGRGSGNNLHPGLGRGGRRGFRSHDSVSAELRPDLYYHRSMVEDPWKLLELVIWKKDPAKSLFAKYSSKSSLSKSECGKKAKITETSNESSSQPSLAEYLAAAFREAAENEATNE